MINKKFLKEAKIIEKKWAESGLLKGIDWKNPPIRFANISKLMECERLMNEKVPFEEDEGPNGGMADADVEK